MNAFCVHAVTLHVLLTGGTKRSSLVQRPLLAANRWIMDRHVTLNPLKIIMARTKLVQNESCYHCCMYVKYVSKRVHILHNLKL